MKRSKSSLKTHKFPLFYACYLLKSVRTQNSTATYIGSTPNPPRRLRQHNGEITQGAWRTQKGRPWVMQMIVHGFPSRHAALQFEWAWQNAYQSRHLKARDGTQLCKRSVTMKAKVSTVRRMLATHPYTLWPLHVTLFTPTAVKSWKDACHQMGGDAPLPLGFRENVTLEGVDGKASTSCADWRSPLDVTDAAFTKAHLSKNASLLSLGPTHRCIICRESIDVASSSALTVAVCPGSDCTAVSHISCLSNHFLATAHQHDSSSSPSAFIPRGGICKACDEYVLWGDVIRASYRRHAGHVALEAEADAEEEAEVDSEVEAVAEAVSERSKRVTRNDKGVSRQPVSGRNGGLMNKSRRRNQFTITEPQSGSDHETFDLDNVSGSESGLSVVAGHIHAKRINLSARKRQRGKTIGDTPNKVPTVHAEAVSSDKVPAILPGKRRERPRKSPLESVNTVQSVPVSDVLGTPKTSRSSRTTKSTTTKHRKRISKTITAASSVPTLDNGFPEKDNQGNVFMDSYTSDADTNERLAPVRVRNSRATRRKDKTPGPVESEAPSIVVVASTLRTPRKKTKPIGPFELVFADLESVASSDSEPDSSPPSASKLLRAMSTLSVSSPASRSASPGRRKNTTRRKSVSPVRDTIMISSDDDGDDVIVLSD